ncbi:MAG: ABC transporter substrate-binding protein [Rhodospirillales bacterium]|nr:ABC transporter substrate-binding protein [Rhodospirillales bacterium]
MILSRRHLMGAGAAALALPTSLPARAAARPKIKLGVLVDMSGPYRDDTGPTSVACTKLAAQDFAAHAGFDIEVIGGDHQNKPDVGAALARQWYDEEGVDAIVDVPNSAVGLAVSTVTREKNKVYLNSGAGVSLLFGKDCSPNTIDWTYDTWMLAHSTGGEMVKQGGDTWYFVTADYVFGHILESDTTELVKKAGGKVLGSARYPFPATSDFSSFLLQAVASGAKVLGLANAGGDTQNCIKQAHEFGIGKKMRIATLLINSNDVRALGPEVAQGIYYTESYYWDANASTRAWNARASRVTPGHVYPNMSQAGDYGATLHYLKAVTALGAKAAKASGRDTVAKMKAMPTEDPCFGKGSIREDGRALHPVYLLQAKGPGETKNSWDVAKIVHITPAAEGWRPMNEGGCPLVHS